MSSSKVFRVGREHYGALCGVVRGMELRGYSMLLVDGVGDIVPFGTLVEEPCFGGRLHDGTPNHGTLTERQTLLLVHDNVATTAFELFKATAFLAGGFGVSVDCGAFTAIRKIEPSVPQGWLEMCAGCGYNGPVLLSHDEAGVVCGIEYGCGVEELFLLLDAAASQKHLLEAYECDGHDEWCVGVHVSLPPWPIATGDRVLGAIPREVLRHFWLVSDVRELDRQLVTVSGDVGCATAHAPTLIGACSRIWRSLHALKDCLGREMQFRVDFMARLKERFFSGEYDTSVSLDHDSILAQSVEHVQSPAALPSPVETALPVQSGGSE